MASLDSLKLELGLSVFEDIIAIGNGNSTGLVQGNIIVSGTLSHVMVVSQVVRFHMLAEVQYCFRLL